jgi:hypothetical protein
VASRIVRVISGLRCQRDFDTFLSVKELTRAIEVYIRENNKKPKPFVWIVTAKSILRELKKYGSVARCVGEFSSFSNVFVARDNTRI